MTDHNSQSEKSANLKSHSPKDEINTIEYGAMIIGAILGMISLALYGWTVGVFEFPWYGSIINALIGGGTGAYSGAIVAKRIVIMGDGAIGRIVTGAVIGAGLVLVVGLALLRLPLPDTISIATFNAFCGAAVAAAIRKATVKSRWVFLLSIVGVLIGGIMGFSIKDSFDTMVLTTILIGAVIGLCFGMIGGLLASVLLTFDDMTLPDSQKKK